MAGLRPVLIRVAIGLGLLAVLALAALPLLNTDAGRALVARQMLLFEPESGLRITVGRIDGSLFKRATVHDLTLADPQGIFLRVPVATLDWQPLGLFQKRVEVRDLSAPVVQWLRLPRLRPTDPDGPILPDIDIHIGKLAVQRIDIFAAVAGRAQTASLTGTADIRSGRARVKAEARGLTSNDRLKLLLDAEPDRDRFDVDLVVTAPAGGVMAKLAGLTQDTLLTVTGDGKWSIWRGRIDGRYGERRLADLSLVADKGRFRVTGVAAPGLVSPGVVQRLAAPDVRIDAQIDLGERRADVIASLSSPQIAVKGAGGLDFAAGRYDGFSIDARLLKPDALLRGASIEGARLTAKLAGTIGRPVVDFVFATPRLAVATTSFEMLKVSGRIDTGGNGSATPINASLDRITGLGPDLQAILSTVRLSGLVSVRNLTLTSDALALTTAKLTGKASLTFDLRSGRYDIGLVGDLPRYPVPGLGLVDVRADLRASPLPTTGQFHIDGRTVAVVTRLDNAVLRSLTDGRPTVSAEIDLPPGTGALVLRDLKLLSPGLRLVGAGDRAADGRLRIAAAGASTRYGPASLKIEGRLPLPRIDVALARPGLGIGLVKAAGSLIPSGDSWAFSATGGSSYGPVSASGRFSSQPAAILVDALQIAGVTAKGTLQTATGLLVGTLSVSGSGTSGEFKFAPSGALQRVNADLKFDRARLTASPPITIGKGVLTANALIGSDTSDITAKLSATGLRRAALTVSDVDLAVNVRDGRGQAKGRVSGRQGAPFQFEGNVDFAPGQLVVAASGTVARQAVRLVTPADLTRVAGGWRLEPVEIDLSNGRATLSGTIGEATALTARLDRIGLGILNLVYPGLGIDGSLSGTVVALLPADGGLPRGRASLRVSRFTRTGIAAVSQPVDLGINGGIDGGVAAMKAVIVRNGVTVGRAQAQLKPIPGRAEDNWAERLLAAPLTAQLRFNGQADALWPLLNIRAFDFKGPLTVAADFGGRLGEPTITGQMTSNGLRFESVVLGTTVENIALNSRFNGSRLEFTSISGIAGKGGSITGSGHIDLSLERGFPVDLRFQANNAQLLRRDDLRATASGPLQIVSDKDGGLIKGDLKVDRAEFRVGRPQLETVPELVVRERGGGLDGATPPRKPTIWRLDIAADAPGKIAVSGMGLDSEWSSKIRVGGQADAPQITGTANLVRGNYEFAGKRFDLTRGRLRFTGNYPPDPQIDIVAAANVQGVTATITIGGTGLQPEIAFSSVPALPEDEVLSRVLFGSSITNLSAPEALQLAAAVASLRGSGGNFDVFGAVRKALRIDRLRVLPGDTTTGRGTSVAAGRYIGDRVYVEVASDAQGYTATQIEIALTRSLSILSQVATVGGNSVNLKWSKDY